MTDPIIIIVFPLLFSPFLWALETGVSDLYRMLLGIITLEAGAPDGLLCNIEIQGMGY